MSNVRFPLGRNHSLGMDGRRRPVVRGQRPFGVPGQSKGHAKGSAAETGERARQATGQRVENRRCS